MARNSGNSMLSTQLDENNFHYKPIANNGKFTFMEKNSRKKNSPYLLKNSYYACVCLAIRVYILILYLYEYINIQ